MHDGIERTKDIELLNCKSGPDYLLSKLRAAISSTKSTQDLWKKQSTNDECLLLKRYKNKNRIKFLSFFFSLFSIYTSIFKRMYNIIKLYG